MCNGPLCLLGLLLAVLIGFAGLIFILLRHRRNILARASQLPAETVWDTISNSAAALRLQRDSLVYGVWHDRSMTATAFEVKDAIGQVVGTVELSAGQREAKVIVGNQTYLIKRPFRADTTAILTDASGSTEFATYRATSIFGAHEFDIEGLGTLKSFAVSPLLRKGIRYRLGNSDIGFCQELSSLQLLGGALAFPKSLPLHLRIFILVAPYRRT